MQQPDSKKIREVIKTNYKEFHTYNIFDGKTYKRYLTLFSKLIPNLDHKLILDYGCGVCGGLKNHYKNVIAYDPYIKQYAKPFYNESIEVIFSSDVLEHLFLNDILDFIRKIKNIKPKYIFLSIALRTANKLFKNGINIHLTVEPAYWWLGLFQGNFNIDYDIIYAVDDMLNNDFVICLKRK